jgi:hypothetical protein
MLSLIGSKGVAVKRTSAGEEARRWPMLALCHGSGSAPCSGSGSSTARQELLAEKWSSARKAVAGGEQQQGASSRWCGAALVWTMARSDAVMTGQHGSPGSAW